jgi:hypothetical protein
VQKVLDFKGVKKIFNQDKELSFKFQLFGLVFLMDGDIIMGVACMKIIFENKWWKDRSKYKSKT